MSTRSAHEALQDAPEPPEGLHETGAGLWEVVTTSCDLPPHSLLILAQACRAADRLDRLAGEIEALSSFVEEGRVQPVINPLIAESRATSLAMARLLTSARIPDEYTSGAKRPQRQSGARAPQREWATKAPHLHSAG